jgi:hypothetical protein
MQHTQHSLGMVCSMSNKRLYNFRILNLSMNRLSSLPRGFGSFPVLEVLDLSYNELNEGVLPANFFMMQTLRALYLRYETLTLVKT